MSMLRTLARNKDRTTLAREIRRHNGRPVSTSRNKVAKKWQRSRLKMARYARLVVGLLMRATGAVDDTKAPLGLVCKIPTPFQERTADAERIVRGSDKLAFEENYRLVNEEENEEVCDYRTGEGFTWRWVPGTSRTEVIV